jgi:hypothetical protein
MMRLNVVQKSLWIIILLNQGNLFAQEKNYFIYPQHLPFESYKSSMLLAQADLPEDQVEEASTFIRGPLFKYQALYGLPDNFQIYGGICTNIVTFHFALGPRWHYQIDKFRFSLGYDIAYWFGELNHFGYNSKVKGWIHYPNLTVGYEFDSFAISLKSELIIQTARHDKSEDVEVKSEFRDLSGFSAGLYIEQPLWKDNYVLLGLKMNYTQFYYPIWAAFSTFDRYFYIPEITIGFNL